jgi:hypothetical protein
MDLKATAYGTLCLTALSLCLCLAGGCGSNTAPPQPGNPPGYFRKGGFKSNDDLIKEFYAAKKKGKAKTKAQAK